MNTATLIERFDRSVCLLATDAKYEFFHNKTVQEVREFARDKGYKINIEFPHGETHD